MPGNGEYDRHEGKELARDFRYWFAGCTIVVAIVFFSFVVYAILLVRSGWHG